MEMNLIKTEGEDGKHILYREREISVWRANIRKMKKEQRDENVNH